MANETTNNNMGQTMELILGAIQVEREKVVIRIAEIQRALEAPDDEDQGLEAELEVGNTLLSKVDKIRDEVLRSILDPAYEMDEEGLYRSLEEAEELKGKMNLQS